MSDLIAGLTMPGTILSFRQLNRTQLSTTPIKHSDYNELLTVFVIMLIMIYLFYINRHNDHVKPMIN